MSADVVEGGRDRGGLHRPRWWSVAVAAGLVVVGAAQAGSAREEAALVACVERAEASLAHTAGRVGAAVQYAGPLLTGAATPAAVRASLAEVVGDAAARGLPALDADARRCADVEVLPWHGSRVAARSAYLERLAVARARLEAVTTSVRVLYVRDAEGDAARAQALEALRRGLSGSRQDRVERLLASP